MSETMKKKNEVVLNIAHGHPGYVDHQIVTTPDAMRKLASGLLEQLDIADNKLGTLQSIECTLAHKRADHIYLSFHTTSKESIENYHKRSLGIRLRKAFGFAYHITTFCFAVYGIYRLFKG
jgi:hypothetical protein